MLAHRILGGCSSSVSVSCPSLGSTLITMARAHLWSSFRWWSESPLFMHPKTKRQEKVSCLFGSSRLFPDSLPASCGTLAPFRLCSRSQPQSSPWDPIEARASAPSPRPPRRVSRQASRAGECCSAPLLCVGISPLCPPHPCGCALLRGSEASPLRHPQSPPAKGLPSVWKPFLLHSSLPLVQVPSLFFCLCFFFFLFALPRYMGSFLPFERSEVLCQRSVGVLNCSTCRCISDVFVGRKVISTSYSSAILKVSSSIILFFFLMAE